MIAEFVKAWEERKGEVEAKFRERHAASYLDIVEAVVSILASDDEWGSSPDASRIHQIDDGHYQGTLVFVIAESGYQPSEYWYVRISYGSCSGCDTLERITGYSSDTPTEEQVKDYMTLALHVLQGIKKMGGDTV